MTSHAHHVYKRGRKTTSEAFDATKLHTSLVNACVSVRTPEGAAEDAARRVVAHVMMWLRDKPEVTSADLRRKAGEALLAYNAEAAYTYNKQLTLIATRR